MTLIVLLSSLWAILIVDDFTLWRQLLDKMGLGYERKWGSLISFIDLIFFIIWKVNNCSGCFSAWLCGFSWLIIIGNGYGFLLMPISYFLTFYIKKSLTTSI